MKKALYHGKAAALGPYSPALLNAGLLYISGQIAMNPESGELIDGDATVQCKAVMENIGLLLKEADMDFSHLLQCRIYLADMNDFAAVNQVYQSFLKEPYPARATIEVSRLPKDRLIEIEAIASGD